MNVTSDPDWFPVMGILVVCSIPLLAMLVAISGVVLRRYGLIGHSPQDFQHTTFEHKIGQIDARIEKLRSEVAQLEAERDAIVAEHRSSPAP